MASRRGPDNSVRVAISGNIDAQNWANIFHAQLSTSSAISQADLDTWTTAFQAAYKTRFASVQHLNTNYLLAKTILYTPGGGELISSIGMTGAGTESGTIGGGASTKVVSWLSNVYWRGGKPRTYSPTCCVADLTASSDLLTAAAVNAMQVAGANFRNDVNALTAGTITATVFGFVSFSSGNAPRTTPAFFPITGARCHPRLGTQRRRLGKWQN